MQDVREVAATRVFVLEGLEDMNTEGIWKEREEVESSKEDNPPSIGPLTDSWRILKTCWCRSNLCDVFDRP